MAVDKTVNQQTEDSTPTTDDYILTWDTGSGASKKVSIANLLLLSNPYKFSVYRSAAWNAFPSPAKVQFDTELFDTGNNFDSTTNYRFTAPVNGFYQFNWAVGSAQTTGIGYGTYLAKNGAELTDGSTTLAAGTSSFAMISTGGKLVQLTAGDYIEVYYVTGTADAGKVTDKYTYFTGYLASKA